MSEFYVSTPIAIMRQEPSDRTQVVSQALFSELVELVDEASQWVKIRTRIDDYQGWVNKTNLCASQEPYGRDPARVVIVDRLAAHLYVVQDTVYGPLMTLPFESRLELADPQHTTNQRWIQVILPDRSQAYIQRGDVRSTPYQMNREEVCLFAERFLGLPYTWGGRSSFGYDCSGFVQMLYRQMGVFLPRDAKDQAGWAGLSPADKPQPADLIFFGHDPQAIQHVGLALGDDRFIHATVAENAPYIRVSHLSSPEWCGCGRWRYVYCRRLTQ